MDSKKLIKHVNCLGGNIYPPINDVLSLLMFFLCRRLNTLNKCAVMKLEISPHRKKVSILNV